MDKNKYQYSHFISTIRFTTIIPQTLSLMRILKTSSGRKEEEDKDADRRSGREA